MARKKISVDWDNVTSRLSDGSLNKLEQFAEQYGISRPTAKKLLQDKYGSSIVFVRGRSGGIIYNPSASPVGA